MCHCVRNVLKTIGKYSFAEKSAWNIDKGSASREWKAINRYETYPQNISDWRTKKLALAFQRLCNEEAGSVTQLQVREKS